MLRRATAQRVVLAAAFLTTVLGAAVLTALLLFTGAVLESGVRRAVAEAPADRVSLEVSARAAAGDPEAAVVARALTERTSAALGGRPARAHVSEISGSFDLPPSVRASGSEQATQTRLPGQPAPGAAAGGPLTVLVAYDDLAGHADLAAGNWPPAAAPRPGEPLPVAAHATAADAMGLRVGQRLNLRERLTDQPLMVEVVGTWRPTDAADPYFFGSPLEVGGERRGTFRELGPLAADPAALAARVPGRSTVRWRIEPDLSTVRPGELAAVREGATTLSAGLPEEELTAAGSTTPVLVRTGLAELLVEVERDVVVARSAIGVPVALVAVLAGYALLLTARLLGEHRRIETALLRARGASRGQLVGWSLREALLLGVPAALLAPPLAVLGLHAVSLLAPLHQAGTSLRPGLPRTAWVAAALAAVAASAVLALPALRGGTWTRSQTARGRPSRRSALARAGGDVAVLLAAGVAYWQLRRYGSPLVRGAEGGLTVDPLLVAAPTLALLAGTALALRGLPLLSRVAEGLASRRRTLGPALGASQVSRRPLRHAGPVLLLVLAVAVGTLSAAHAATWRRAQQDRAGHEVGADVRVSADPATASAGAALAGADRAAAYAAVPGVAAVLPVHREAIRVGGRGGQLLAVDAARAARVMTVREDLLPAGSLAERLDPLAEGRPGTGGVELPGGVERIDVAASVEVVGAPDAAPVRLALLHRDRVGTVRRRPLGELPPDGRVRTLTASVPATVDPSGAGEPARLAGLDVTVLAPVDAPRSLTLHVLGVRPAADPAASPFEVAQWSAIVVRRPIDGVAPTARVVPAPDGTAVRLTTGQAPRGPTPATVRLVAGAVPGIADPPAALVTAGALARAGLTAGDPLTVIRADGQLVVRVAGTIWAMPSVPPGTEAVLVDLPTLAAVDYSRQESLLEPDEWWVDLTETAGTDPSAVEAALVAVPGAPAEVTARATVAARLLADPLGVGVLGALGASLLAAGTFAVVGFGLHGAVAARERRAEFALLRVVGASRRQLVTVLVIEQGLLTAVGVALGVVLGGPVAVLVLAHVVPPPDGVRAVPEVLVAVPLATVATFAGSVSAALALVTAALARSARRAGTSGAMRLGEDR